MVTLDVMAQTEFVVAVVVLVVFLVDEEVAVTRLVSLQSRD